MEVRTYLCITVSVPTAGTPYEGGLFKMKLVLGKDFPATPPQGTRKKGSRLAWWQVMTTCSTHTHTHTHRLFLDQNLPPKCGQEWCHLCQHPQERLEVRPWHQTHPPGKPTQFLSTLVCIPVAGGPRPLPLFVFFTTQKQTLFIPSRIDFVCFCCYR